MGEFEHARDINANGDPRMILGDRSESVYVYPVRAQVFAVFDVSTVYFKPVPVMMTVHFRDDRPLLT